LQAIDFVADFKQALAQTQEPVAVYGYCPECGAKGVMRERRPNGNDKCANGHTYPSSASTPPQRTWVGLTWEEIDECFKIGPINTYQRKFTSALKPNSRRRTHDIQTVNNQVRQRHLESKNYL
jgi:hypothetical protein